MSEALFTDWPSHLNRAKFYRRFTNDDRILCRSWVTGPIGEKPVEGSPIWKLGMEFSRCVERDMVDRAERCYLKIQEIKSLAEKAITTEVSRVEEAVIGGSSTTSSKLVNKIGQNSKANHDSHAPV
jgi:hypothetical protein